MPAATSGVVSLGAWAAAHALRRHRPFVAWVERWCEAIQCGGQATLYSFSLETDRLNAAPSQWLQRVAGDRTRGVLRLFYNAGVYAAGMLMVLMVCILSFVSLQVFHRLTLPAAHLAKRDTSPTWLTPVIPGVTVPFTILLPLFLVVLASQAVHESGHAIAAALHRIKPHAMGLSVVFPFLPVAYVALPEMHGRCTRREQLRIVSAGVAHNLGLLFLLRVAVFLGIGRLLWKDAHGLRVVHSGDANLAQWMPVHATITAVDDTALDALGSRERIEAWDAFLQGDGVSKDGWCVAKDAWTAASSACCQVPQPDMACFVAQASACLDPVAIFSNATRCEGGCSGVCVRPAAHELLGRVAVKQGPASELVVLRGPFDAMQRSIQVSPSRLPVLLMMVLGTVGTNAADTMALFIHYLEIIVVMVNVALAFFNMLPLPSLDGGAYLRLALVEYYAQDVPDTYMLDADDVEGGAVDTPWAPLVHRVLAVAQYTTIGLMVVALGGSTWLTLRS